MREILVAIKNGNRYWRTIGEEKVAYLSQYDSFIEMRSSIGEPGDALSLTEKYVQHSS